MPQFGHYRALGFSAILQVCLSNLSFKFDIILYQPTQKVISIVFCVCAIRHRFVT